LLLLLVIVFIFNSCIREDENLADKVSIIAHRGYHLTKLENSYESFQAAAKKGFKHLEFDIFFTKDYQPVILHDGDLSHQTDTTGSISDFLVSDLRNIQLNGGYKIPILDTVLQRFGNSFETIFIDFKEPCPDSALISFVEIIKKNNSYKNTITTCMNPDVIRRLKQMDAGLTLGSDGAANGFEDNLDECIKSGYKHVLVYHPQLDKHLCFIAHARGIKVYAYSPNSEQELVQSLSYDIDGIMTDNPDLLRQIIE